MFRLQSLLFCGGGQILNKKLDVLLYIPLLSLADLKLHQNTIVKIGLKGLDKSGYISTVICFVSLLMILESVRTCIHSLFFS